MRVKVSANVVLVLSATVSLSLQAADTILISRTSNGNPGNALSVFSSSDSTGMRIAFESQASDLVSGITGSTKQIYVYDRSNNVMVLVSKNNDGTPGNNTSSRADISADGKFVVFTSYSTNLTTDNTNGKMSVFVRDLIKNKTILVSKTYSGVAPDDVSDIANISGDGRYVVFESSATNLVIGDTNAKRDIFLFDTSTLTMERINVGLNNTQANDDSFGAKISANGEWITFTSIATNLTSIAPNSTNYNVYLYNRLNKTLQRISHDSAGISANGRSYTSDVSDDGRYIVYPSLATNLSSIANDGKAHVFVYDRITNTTTLVDKTSGGTLANGQTLATPTISGNGRHVIYASNATNLVAGDTNGFYDIFSYDRITQTTEMITLSSSGQLINANPGALFSSSYNGQLVAFNTSATVLDSNNFNDIYQRVRNPIANSLPVAIAGNNIAAQCTGNNTVLTLDASASYDLDGNIAEYKWTGSFGTVYGVKPQILFGVGSYNVTLTVTDDLGGSQSSNLAVTVSDSVAPVVTAENNIVIEATTVNGTPYTVGYTAIDNCSNTFVTVNPTPSYYPLGITQVTITARDTTGNTGYANTSITVRDTTPPVLQIPNDVVAEASGILTPAVLGDAIATDIFPVVTQNSGNGKYPLGTTYVTWTATDTNGNASNGVQKVTVVDTIAPIVNAGNDVTLEASNRAGAAFNPNPSISDSCACGPIQVTVDPELSYYPLGQTLVHIFARDISGNVGNDSLLLNVVDTTPPVVTTPADKIVEATAIESIVDIGMATATDIFDVTLTHNAPTAFSIGTTAVIWTAIDTNGNQNSATQKVTVRDTTAPIVTVTSPSTFEATARQTPITLTKPSVVEIFPVTVTHNAPLSFPLGTTNVQWTVTDSNGNVAASSQDVKIVDTTAPTITAPADVSAEAADTLTAVALGQAIANDIFDVTVANNAPVKFPLGNTAVVWTATDTSGNHASARQTVRIVDTTPPIVDLGADVMLEATSIDGATYNLKMNIDDKCHCGPIDVTTSPNLTTYPLGKTVVTVSAKDISGNVGNDSIAVTVADTTPPTIVAPSSMTVEATGAFTNVVYGTAKASDIFPVTITNNAPALFPVGSTVITWSAKDSNGNIATASQTITVVDTTAPNVSLDVLKDKLWSPNHKLVLAAIVRNVNDVVDANPIVNVEVNSNQSETNGRRHDHRDDWKVEKRGTEWKIYLRAEKNHDRKDLVYQIAVTVSDQAGNTATRDANVVVNHDRRDHAEHNAKQDDRKEQTAIAAVKFNKR